MTHYLVTIFRPNDYDPAVEDAAMIRGIAELNQEMVAAGVRVFVGGLQPPRSAHSVRVQSDGTLLMTHGTYLQTPEHIGGLWVLKTATPDEALAWGRKAAVACRAHVEVRSFH